MVWGPEIFLITSSSAYQPTTQKTFAITANIQNTIATHKKSMSIYPNIVEMTVAHNSFRNLPNPKRFVYCVMH